MDTYLAIASKRDERRYADTPVPQEVRQRILDAGRLVRQLAEHAALGVRGRVRSSAGPAGGRGLRAGERPLGRARRGHRRRGRRLRRRPLLAEHDARGVERGRGLVSERCPRCSCSRGDLRRRGARDSLLRLPAARAQAREPHAPRSGRRGRTASRCPSSCARSRSSTGTAGFVPANAARRLCTSTSNEILTTPDWWAWRSTIPSGLRTRQPVEACQYGDQCTATRYSPARETWITSRDSRNLSTLGPAGAVDDRLWMRDGVDRDLVGREHAAQVRAAAAHEPLLGA